MLSLSNLWCLRTCWIELSLQPELDFALLQELPIGCLFGSLLDSFPFPFRCQTHLRAIETFFASLAALWHPPGITAQLRSLFASSWVPFAALGVSFQGIRSLSTWFHCPLSGAFNHGFGLRFTVP